MQPCNPRLGCQLSLVAALCAAGCAGVERSRYTHDTQSKPHQAVKSEGCYDAAVLVERGLADAATIARQALSAVDARIDSAQETTIKAQRNRHIGLFVGSGGEELFVTLQPVSSQATFVTVATRTGFVGGAGQKAWSCVVVDQIIALATRR